MIEKRAKKLHAKLYIVENLCRVNEIRLAIANKYSHFCRCFLVVVFNNIILTSAEAVNVRTDRRTWFKVKQPALVEMTWNCKTSWLESFLSLCPIDRNAPDGGVSSICNYLPVIFWSYNWKLERSSYARLVETREESVAKEWLQVGEDVVFLIFDILVKVQTCTVGHIRVFELEANQIFLGAAQLRLWKPNPMFFKFKTTGRLSIYDNIRNFLALKVQEKLLWVTFILKTFGAVVKRHFHGTFKTSIFFVCQLQ